jgi:hypothetical protein
MKHEARIRKAPLDRVAMSPAAQAKSRHQLYSLRSARSAVGGRCKLAAKRLVSLANRTCDENLVRGNMSSSAEAPSVGAGSLGANGVNVAFAKASLYSFWTRSSIDQAKKGFRPTAAWTRCQSGNGTSLELRVAATISSQLRATLAGT